MCKWAKTEVKTVNHKCLHMYNMCNSSYCLLAFLFVHAFTLAVIITAGGVHVHVHVDLFHFLFNIEELGQM